MMPLFVIDWFWNPRRCRYRLSINTVASIYSFFYVCMFLCFHAESFEVQRSFVRSFPPVSGSPVKLTMILITMRKSSAVEARGGALLCPFVLWTLINT